jgi:hypothetical protein
VCVAPSSWAGRVYKKRSTRLAGLGLYSIEWGSAAGLIYLNEEDGNGKVQ